MGNGAFPLLGGDGAQQEMGGPLLLLLRGKPQGMRQPRDLGRSRSGAEQRDLDQARMVARVLGARAEESEIMAQQRGERLCREVLEQGLEQQVQECRPAMAHQGLAR